MGGRYSASCAFFWKRAFCKALEIERGLVTCFCPSSSFLYIFLESHSPKSNVTSLGERLWRLDCETWPKTCGEIASGVHGQLPEKVRREHDAPVGNSEIRKFRERCRMPKGSSGELVKSSISFLIS